jgi:glutamate-1-semialdehyde 2,1-aminomutase
MNYLYNENPKNKVKAKKAKGKHIYIGGKKLLDLSNASGSLLLGHTSSVYKKSLDKLKSIGSNYSLINTFVEEYSLMLKKIFPEYSKFIMCATGTESNMKALRIARAITNKKKIAMVSGSWHGSVDELLYSSKDNKCKIKKILSGGLANNKNTILIPYNNFNVSKKILDKNKKKIALLIIEPIQQSMPLNESEEFIKLIYKYCKKNNILLCFDEMISGLRLPELSVYKKLKTTPDILTFGKIFGGGVPIGIIGITKKVENLLSKNKDTVFFGGTYSLNPFSSYLGLNTIKYIYKNRNKIYYKLETLSEILATQLNNFIYDNDLDLKVIRYASVLRIIYSNKSLKNKFEKDLTEKKKIKKIIKFKKYIYDNNIFLSKNGAIFLSYQHSIKDIKSVINVFKSGFKKFLI